MPIRPITTHSGSDSLRSDTFDQLCHRVRNLCSTLLPKGHTCQIETQRIGGSCNAQRVIKTQPLDKTTIAPITGIGHDHIVERTITGTATGQTDHNHVYLFLSEWHAGTPLVPKSL
ncbi:hypothetical protein CARN8_1790013 [mine drainage metagenome]|uniref:Uncharacterized protein n=1 Tax=mine drainage metagenome TaxID=410659 RepID=A0A3P3ZMS7_9ZZZZ